MVGPSEFLRPPAGFFPPAGLGIVENLPLGTRLSSVLRGRVITG
jgi:hypothetical protein